MPSPTCVEVRLGKQDAEENDQTMTAPPRRPCSLEPDYLDGDKNVLPSFASIRAKNLLTLYGQGGDKSPKGSVDHPILELVNLINSHPSFVTLSSCSGRIALFDPPRGSSTTGASAAEDSSNRQNNDFSLEGDSSSNNNNNNTKGGQWLIACHEKLDFESLWNVLSKINGDTDDDDDDDSFLTLQDSLSFRFEPMLLHVAAATLERGQQLLQIALQHGYRESGLIVTSSRITVAIRSYSLSLVVPVILSKNRLFPISYWQALVQESNRRLDLNLQRLDQLYGAVVKGIFQHSMLPSLTATPLPMLSVWGHTAVSAPRADGELDIVVFGGYGSGPQTIDDCTTTCKRMETIYRLCRSKGRWSTQWDMVQTEPQHSTETFRELPVCPFEWTARESAASCRIPQWDIITDDSSRIIGGVIFGGRRGPACPLNDLILFEYVADKHNNSPQCRFYQATKMRGPHPSPRWGHTLTYIQGKYGESNSLAVLIGGRNEASVVCDSIYILSEQSAGVNHSACLQWEQLTLPDETMQRFHHTAVTIHDTVFVFGGLCETNNLLEEFRNDAPPTPSVVSFTFTPTPTTVNVRGTESVPRLFGLTSCLMSSLSTEYHILLSGGISGSPTESKRGAFLSAELCRKTDAWEISTQELEADITRLNDLGPLIHHQCISIPSTNKGIDCDPQIISVGGGVSGFAFRPTFSSSFVMSRRQGNRDVLRQKISEQNDDAQKASRRTDPTELPETTNVVYVRKQDAKFVKTQLEKAALLDRKYRMCPANPSAASDLSDPSSCIAIPIDGIDIRMLDENENKTHTGDLSDESKSSLIASCASLILGFGKQKAPRSTATFARHTGSKPKRQMASIAHFS